jgi:hypothetical protein
VWGVWEEVFLYPVLKRCFTWAKPKTALFAFPFTLSPLKPKA